MRPSEDPPEGYVWSHRFDDNGSVVETFGNSCPPGLIATLGEPRLVQSLESRREIEIGMANYYRMIGCKGF